MSRHAGLIIPLFSVPTGRSWGIGELPDLAAFGPWMAAAGFDRVMILPLGTLPAGETSPYSAMSTMAIDPLYIALDDLEDFAPAGGIEALPAASRQTLTELPHAPRIRYDAVRAVKRQALEHAFDRFVSDEWEQLTPRSAALAVFIARERAWLDDYALFRALSVAAPGLSWRDWPPPLRDRDPRALDQARRQFARVMLREQYWQWIASQQWSETRRRLHAAGIAVFGDLPFGVGLESPEVWARTHEFMLDVSTGVPPDAFSETGQDWKLPTYRWDVIAASDFAWLRARIARAAALFDGVRVDHLVGLYRTYGKPPDGEAFFNPPDEPSQLAQGEHILGILQNSGLAVIAEDLGTVPDFVRASLARLGVPGSKVLRWERAWTEWHRGFIDPATFPARSMALTGTHDNTPLAAWWDDEATTDDRAALLALPVIRAKVADRIDQPWSDRLRDALTELLYRAGSDEVFLPIQDVFGWKDRINTPATIGDHNWTWKLPWPVEDATTDTVPAAKARAQFLHALAAGTGRRAT